MDIRAQKRIKYFPTAAKINALIIVSIFLLFLYTTNKDEGFAIYLTKDDIYPAQLPALSHVEIDEHPIITHTDIITYNAYTHEISLTASAFNRISSLEVPIRGKSFVICVDKKPIYCGAFWTPISSISFDGVTIWKPLHSQELNIIKLELGYPSPHFYGGEDPRNNEEILKSLKQAGKLINRPSNTIVYGLPHSMKGYELYSWLENNQWHFTLITGTNRIKTIEEITVITNIISQDGWVQIHVEGVDTIKTVLSRLPLSEDVYWFSMLNKEQTKQNNIIITLPPGSTIDALKEHSEKYGLNLIIQSIS